MTVPLSSVVLLVLTLACYPAVARPPSEEALTAAGTTVKKNHVGGIVELRFNGQAVDREILAALPTLPALTSLLLAGTDGDDRALVPIGKITALKNLDLRECASLDDSALEPVGKLTSLERLNLWRVPVGDVGITHLASLVRLRWLNLDNTLLSDAGLKALSGMKNFEFLHVGSTAVSNAGIDRLAAVPTLQEVHLARTAVDTQGSGALKKQLPDARVIVQAVGD